MLIKRSMLDHHHGFTVAGRRKRKANKGEARKKRLSELVSDSDQEMSDDDMYQDMAPTKLKPKVTIIFCLC